MSIDIQEQRIYYICIMKIKLTIKNQIYQKLTKIDILYVINIL